MTDVILGEYNLKNNCRKYFITHNQKGSDNLKKIRTYVEYYCYFSFNYNIGSEKQMIRRHFDHFLSLYNG